MEKTEDTGVLFDSIIYTVSVSIINLLHYTITFIILFVVFLLLTLKLHLQTSYFVYDFNNNDNNNNIPTGRN